MHRVFLDQIPEVAQIVEITGDEAAHALRVKRLAAGDSIELLDGQGTVADGSVLPDADADATRRRSNKVPRLTVRVNAVRRLQPTKPRLEVLSATPKGSHVDEMIDQLSQIGVDSWRPLRCARSVVDPREGKLDRLQRIAREACKQAGRAWLMQIGAPIEFAAALAGEAGALSILADASGGPPVHSTVVDHFRLLIGPEGGFTPEELAAARTAGVAVMRFGPHAMRIETAAVAASAVLLSSSTVQ